MKKAISLLLTIIMMCSFFTTVNAANELDGAKNYTLGSSKSGSVVEGDEKDVYKFQLTNSSKLRINYSAGIERSALKLYDENGKEIWHENPGWNSTTEEISFQSEIYLCKGTYYFSVSKYYGFGDYEFVLDCTEIYESFSEEQNGSNNSVKTANDISHGNKYVGCIALNDEVDVYSFSLAQSGRLDIIFSANIERSALKLYDENGKEIWHENPGWNSTTELISYQESIYLCKGEYYFSVSKYYGYGDYDLSLLLTGSNESFAENQNGNNNKVNEASLININQKYNGVIALNDEVDIYRISVSDSSATLKLDGNIERVALKIYDATGKEIWHENPGWNSTTEQITYSKEHKLASGLYYLSVSKYYGYGNYSFYFTNGGAISEATSPNSVITVKVNGSSIAFDQPPVLENGRTLVPLRAIFEALGANVQWDGNTQTVMATKNGVIISLQIGSTQMYVNENVKTLDVPAKLINSRTLVPVRAISEAFGCTVDWDGNTQTVLITQ